MSKNKLIVTLLVRKGKKGIEGDDINERFNVKIEYGTADCKRLKETTVEWQNYLKNCKTLGVYTLDVVKVQEYENGQLVEVETPLFIENQVKEALSTPKEELTQEQIKIKELEEKLEKLLSLTESKDVKEEITLDEARLKYENAFGKKPHHKKTVDGILEDIKNK